MPSPHNGPTITAKFADGPLAGRSTEAEVVEGRPPKTLDETADDEHDVPLLPRGLGPERLDRRVHLPVPRLEASVEPGGVGDPVADARGAHRRGSVVPLDDAPAIDLMTSADGTRLPVQEELIAAAGARPTCASSTATSSTTSPRTRT